MRQRRLRVVRAAVAVCLASLQANAARAGAGDSPADPPARIERLDRSGGTSVVGRLSGSAEAGFQFQPAAGGEAVALERGALVSFEGPEPGPLAASPPFHALLGLGQRVSGQLGRVSDTEVRLEAGPGGRPVTLVRGGVLALVQRPGEAQVFSDGFETIDPGRWVSIGAPKLVEEPRLAGGHSLQVPAGGMSLTSKLPEPVSSGRFEVSYHDSGVGAPEQRWSVDLTFRGPTGLEPIRAVLGWEEQSLAVESPQGPALAVQRLARKPGWHRLVVRFGPGRIELSVDGAELAHGNGPGGPLVEIRLASHSMGKNAPPAGLAAYLDDLSLARLAEPAGGLEIDTTQDEARLVGGDQVFGRIRSADAERVLVLVNGKEAMLDWTEVAGLYFRRAPVQSAAIEGLLVRVEWRAAGVRDRLDFDSLEGALVAVSNTELTLATPYIGTVTLPRDRLRSLRVLGRAKRVILDATSHHLGNEVFDREIKLDPPQPEGGTLEVPFHLEKVPEGEATLALDVIQVAGEADHLPFASLIKKGELRTNVLINGRQVDYLNRYITSKNETSERIRLKIPAGLLHAGSNWLRLVQVGTANDPGNLDDLGVLCTALEFATVPPAAPSASRPGP